jgi:hypothetical protein
MGCGQAQSEQSIAKGVKAISKRLCNELAPNPYKALEGPFTRLHA